MKLLRFLLFNKIYVYFSLVRADATGGSGVELLEVEGQAEPQRRPQVGQDGIQRSRGRIQRLLRCKVIESWVVVT